MTVHTIFGDFESEEELIETAARMMGIDYGKAKKIREKALAEAKERRRVGLMRNGGYIEDLNGEMKEWKEGDEFIEKWLRENPPIYYWVFDLEKDGTIGVYQGNPDTGEHELTYKIHCRNAKKVCDALDYKGWKMRQADSKYTLCHRREGLGLTDEIVDYCVKNLPPDNYGADSTFAIPMGESEWGYGYDVEVKYKHPHYSDGREFDTYANYDYPRTKYVPEPSKRDLVKYCERIEVKITFDFDTRTTPTKVIEKAIALSRDKRIKAIMEEILKADKPI